MKKLICILMSMLMIFSVFCGCNSHIAEESSLEESDSQCKTTIRIAGMKGPTSIGFVGMLEQDAHGSSVNDYEFTLAGAADEITPKLVKGELDVAAVPANLASVLYNNTDGEIQLLAVNTLGVLYIVSKGENVGSLDDLKGKTILATGKGTTPEYTLRYILSQKGIDPDNDVKIEFKNEASEVVAAMKQAETAIAMLPQPYVTVASSQIEGLTVAIDLNEEWESLNAGNGIVTGVLVGRREFIENNKAAVNALLEEYSKSVSDVNADAANASKLVEKFGIFDKAAVMEKAIPYCNITFIKGEAMKAPVSEYLDVLFRQNPKSVGGALPKDDFYYEG